MTVPLPGGDTEILMTDYPSPEWGCGVQTVCESPSKLRNNDCVNYKRRLRFQFSWQVRILKCFNYTTQFKRILQRAVSCNFYPFSSERSHFDRMPVFQETANQRREFRVLPSRELPLPRLTSQPDPSLSSQGKHEVVVIGVGPKSPTNIQVADEIVLRPAQLG